MAKANYQGPLDLLHGVQSIAYSVGRALSKDWRGQPLIRVQRTLDGAMQVFNADATTGLVNAAAVNAFIGSRTVTSIGQSVSALSDMIRVDDATGIMPGMQVSGPTLGEYSFVRDVSAAPLIQLTVRPAIPAGSLITFTDVGGIETLYDQGGSSNDAVQTNIVQQPLWEPNIGGAGRPGMSTNTKFSPQERGGFLATENMVTIPSGKFTVFTAVSSEDTGYGSLTPICGIDGLNLVFDVYLGVNFYGRSGITNEMYDQTNYIAWESNPMGPVAYDEPHVLNVLFNSQGPSSSFFNGVQYPYLGTAKAMGPITGQLAIGSQDASLFSNSFKGDMGEFIFCADIPQGQAAAKVRQNMAAFYG